MTASQLHDARMLIPGAYELNAPPHRARALEVVPATSSEEVHARTATTGNAHVVAAPTRPTTRLGQAAAILGDVALLASLIYGVAVVPALVMWGIEAASALVVATFGRQ